MISECKDKEYILIGHSLCARIIFNCLNFMNYSGFKTNISEVHLLGGVKILLGKMQVRR